jgi:hypothetical protein
VWTSYFLSSALMPGHVLPVIIDGVDVGQIPVTDLMP